MHFFKNVSFPFPEHLFSVSLPFMFRLFHQRFFTMSTVSFAFLLRFFSVSLHICQHLMILSCTASTFLYRFQNISITFLYHFFNVSSLFLYRFRVRFFTISIIISFPFPARKRNGQEMPTAFFRTLSKYVYIYYYIGGSASGMHGDVFFRIPRCA